jgi:hypothetical protein
MIPPKRSGDSALCTIVELVPTLVGHCPTERVNSAIVSAGSYGNFEIMPLFCPGGFETCTTTLDARERRRKPSSDGKYCEMNMPALPCIHSTCLRCVPRLLYPNVRQQYQDGGNSDATGWTRALYVPSRKQVIFCLRPYQRFAQLFRWRGINHRPCERENHHRWIVALKVRFIISRRILFIFTGQFWTFKRQVSGLFLLRSSERRESETGRVWHLDGG